MEKDYQQKIIQLLRNQKLLIFLKIPMLNYLIK